MSAVASPIRPSQCCCAIGVFRAPVTLCVTESADDVVVSGSVSVSPERSQPTGSLATDIFRRTRQVLDSHLTCPLPLQLALALSCLFLWLLFSLSSLKPSFSLTLCCLWRFSSASCGRSKHLQQHSRHQRWVRRRVQHLCYWHHLPNSLDQPQRCCSPPEHHIRLNTISALLSALLLE